MVEITNSNGSKRIPKTVGIVGYGWVGKAMKKLFPDAKVYDVKPQNFTFFDTKEAINLCDVVFICVPTPNMPMGKDEGTTPKYPSESEGKLDMSIVEEVVSWCEAPLLVMRSTVNPNTCDNLSVKYGKRIVFQPEYLGETPAHPMLDPTTRQFLIIGGDETDRRMLIDLYSTVYNANTTIKQVTALEAEIIKLSENRAIAFKVAECQELYDACERAGVDYYTIRDAVYSDDPRFNLWWTFIYPDKRGFKSKCIPKDVYAWCSWVESLGYNPEITRKILERNKKWIQTNSS